MDSTGIIFSPDSKSYENLKECRSEAKKQVYKNEIKAEGAWSNVTELLTIKSLENSNTE